MTVIKFNVCVCRRVFSIAHRVQQASRAKTETNEAPFGKLRMETSSREHKLNFKLLVAGSAHLLIASAGVESLMREKFRSGNFYFINSSSFVLQML
jgi:hypothetical protein